MTTDTGFLLYAALYRLAVLAVGALSIWLGFRLFSNAKQENSSADGSVSAEGGGFKLAFTNLLPGTYFALFGTVIISVMLWKGEPQFFQQELKELTKGEKTVTTTELRTSIELEWKKLDKSGITLAEAAETMETIAKLLRQENRIGEAVAMAKLAALYGKEEGRAERLDLLAELLRANGNEEEAVQTEQAAESLRRPEK
ncbi:MAG: hypothetical protein CDV28_12913 [Candidatus Electronema aureum]|uniref:Uncharacterized protein n=1 Tax=Candidatus Electronema aureum TaxID=2005002 RepID=A0A521FZZ9_9BACT|nr:MAG: hypothetical protein CDV28_12913 [Candidatus Electronema aureum]